MFEIPQEGNFNNNLTITRECGIKQNITVFRTSFRSIELKCRFQVDKKRTSKYQYGRKVQMYLITPNFSANLFRNVYVALLKVSYATVAHSPTASKMDACGVRKGWPDFFLNWMMPGGRWIVQNTLLTPKLVAARTICSPAELRELNWIVDLTLLWNGKQFVRGMPRADERNALRTL